MVSGKFARSGICSSRGSRSRRVAGGGRHVGRPVRRALECRTQSERRRAAVRGELGAGGMYRAAPSARRHRPLPAAGRGGGRCRAHHADQAGAGVFHRGWPTVAGRTPATRSALEATDRGRPVRREEELAELRQRRDLSLQMGGPAQIQRQHEHGKLTARERIGLLADEGSFREFGMLSGAGTYEDGKLVSFTPKGEVTGLPKSQRPSRRCLGRRLHGARGRSHARLRWPGARAERGAASVAMPRALRAAARR